MVSVRTKTVCSSGLKSVFKKLRVRISPASVDAGLSLSGKVHTYRRGTSECNAEPDKDQNPTQGERGAGGRNTPCVHAIGKEMSTSMIDYAVSSRPTLLYLV